MRQGLFTSIRETSRWSALWLALLLAMLPAAADELNSTAAPGLAQVQHERDTDGDGIDDRIDPDDDNDGILDKKEGKGDTDGDGVPDRLDVDSDGDGIPDVVEAQPFGDVVLPSGEDADGDGIDDAYDTSEGGTPLDPIDSDGDRVPDFRDEDSDNDGVPDATEGHDADMDGVPDTLPSGMDRDGDGMDDAYDNVEGPDPQNAGGSNAPLQDTDDDGIPDWRDDDDDGDGVPTLIEGGDDSDGDGTPDYLDPDTQTSPDTDGDGVPDIDDKDDDNDGILDSREGRGDSDGDGITDRKDIDSDNDGIPDNFEGQAEGEYIPPTGMDSDGDGLDDAYDPGAGGVLIDPVDTDGDGTPDYKDLDSDNDTVPDATEGHDADMNGVPDTVPSGMDSDRDGLDDAYDTVDGRGPGNEAGSNAPLQDSDGDDTRDWRDTDDDNDGTPTRDEDANGNGDPTDDDTDGDGTPDYLDPDRVVPDDSDGDGVPDDVDPDDDNDGILDEDEGDPDADDDGDGIPNRLDIDSDGDGIVDTVEGQPEGSTTLPSGNDTDGDGIDDAFDPDQGGTPITPVDTDGDGTPDFRDLDSDNDNVPDSIEGHDADMDGVADTLPSGNDADGDGLDDAYDTVPGPDPLNSSGSNAPLQDSDGDGTRDWRDTDDDDDGVPTRDEDANGNGDPTDDDTDGDGTPDYLDPDTAELEDSDGDGVPDNIDPDDDNDGILDTDEGDGDTDGDGLPNRLDIDSDGDGIVDTVEGQPEGSTTLPSGNDTDGDGIDDAFDPDQGGTPIDPVDTDGDGTPDFRDLDSDNDNVPDSTEGHDADMDGVADTLPSGTDSDGDGLDDAYDTVSGPDPLNSTGSNAPLQDTDGDGTRDWRDTDDDGDGVPTAEEDADGDGDPRNDDTDGDGTPDYLDPDQGQPTDSDGDGVPDDVDPDDDNDGILDEDEGDPDADDDGDGIPNRLDIDSDGDGIVDTVEGQPEGSTTLPSGNDTDGDGIDDAFDPDQGGTPITPVDTDGDGTPDFRDQDSDNDSVPDSVEGHDADMDGVADTLPSGEDADGDGLDDAYDTVPGPDPLNSSGSNAPVQDSDGDGTRDWRDIDDDNDGIPTRNEDPNGNGDPTDDDSDGDGTPDYLDADSGEPTDSDGDGVPDDVDPDDDNDGILDEDEGDPDADDDGDGIPNRLDIDSDGDGIVDTVEGQPEGSTTLPSGNDSDGDGIDDAFDPDQGGTPITPVDTDGDGTPDFRDLDSDNDNVPDSTEGHDADMDGVPDTLPSGMDSDGDGLDDAYDTVAGPDPLNSSGSNAPLQDTDGDGTRDWRDTDDDNDGVPTRDEDANGDGDPRNDDQDGDGTPDYLDPDTGELEDSDGDGVPDNVDPDDDNDGILDVDEGDEDTDGDGLPDRLDIDSDNDGIVDTLEGQPEDGATFPSGQDNDGDGIDDAFDPDQGGTPITPVDTDGDGTPDFRDLDSDNDTVPDSTEGHDANMDGVPDTLPTGEDSDNDGLDDAYDSVTGPDPLNAGGSNAPLQDTDGDGTRDWRDTDDDGDGVATRDEDANGDGDPRNDDSDGDGTPDYLDPDSAEQPDRDGDGVPDNIDPDDDNDGILDEDEGDPDADDDGDGLPNRLDIDSDGDGIVDTLEGQPEGATVLPTGVDTDGDGIDDAFDPDQGGTPITPVDTDGDGTPDFRDLDSDNDDVPDATEGHDANMDGVPDTLPTGEDSDNDGLDDAYDTVPGPDPLNSTGSNAPLQDTDDDGTRDWRDTDDDGDGVPTRQEDANGDGDPRNDDSDGDGTPDYLDPDTAEQPDSDGDGVPDNIDPDDDNDGILDVDEGDGDTDGDGLPDRLDIDADGDGIVDTVEGQPEGSTTLPSGNDSDGDGIDDAFDPDQGGTPIDPVDTDGDGTPDFRDLDSDNDNVPDATEGHDADMDGVADTAPTGSDSDGDGLDDAYDTVDGPAPLNSTGSNAPVQDSDGDGTRDWRDTDDDNDGIPTRDEDANGDGDPRNDDQDGDGTPDYLDPDTGELEDSDGDGVPDNVDPDDDNDGILDVDEGDGDTDGDGLPDRLDIDADGDGIVDTLEGQPEGSTTLPSGNDSDGDGIDDAFDPDQGGTPIDPVDTDGDGTPDFRDLDSDNDTVPDSTEGHDADMDGVADTLPSGSDSDNDGLDDAYDTVPGPDPLNSTGSNAPLQDSDGDSTRDWRDTDDDGDGVPTRQEDANGDGDPRNDDTDGDGTPDYLDPDTAEQPDSDGDGVPDNIDPDDDNDGILDPDEGDGDTDGDGIPDRLDIDSDNDGIVDTVEGQPEGGTNFPTGNDTDGDGIDDAFDPDQGGTPIVPVDSDNDGTPDVRDLDSDNDMVPDSTEGHDADMDGVPDTLPSGSDADGDGLDDAYDTVPGPDPFNATGSNAPLQDTDGDDTRDWRDTDDDGDGILTMDEDANGDGDPRNDDQDGDGTPDYLDVDTAEQPDSDGDGVPDNIDPDDDNDGILDVDEGDGDTDGDGRPDRLDIDADGDGIVDTVEGQPEGSTTQPSGNDTDGDGIDDAFDPDQGGTPIDPVDTDGDDTPDYRDLDSDNDTVPDATEGHDANMDGVPDTLPSGNDADMDGLDDAYDTVPGPDPLNSTGSNAPLQNTDGDETRDWRDTDDDGDGVPTAEEDQNGDGDPRNDDSDRDGTPDYLDTDVVEDNDGDGIPNGIDVDDDNDGILDVDEGDGDSDGDGVIDSLDIDSDNDGIPDLVEGQPEGPLTLPTGNDQDGDGLDDAFDPDQGGTPIDPVDTDEDGTPDYLDLDSDNDTVPDATEGHDADMDGVPDILPGGSDADNDGLDDAFDTVTAPADGNSAGSNAPLQDTDEDGTRDWRDTDDDNDGTPTAAEDPDGDGDPRNDDSDGDGTPDYLDSDSGNMGVVLVQKSAGVRETGIAGLVSYSVIAENVSAAPVPGLSIRDTQAAGFKYVDESGRLHRSGLDGQLGTPDDVIEPLTPVGTRPMEFGPFDLAPNESVSISYVLRVGSGVLPGRAVNNATPLAAGNVIGNTATASVEVLSGDPILEKTTIIGKVFVDVNGDGRQDEGEPGIPGVRLGTATGLLIETDSEGRYHIADVDAGRADRGRNVIVKVDPTTLPPGFNFTTENPRVIHITQALMGRINFGVRPAPGAVASDRPSQRAVEPVELPGGGTLWITEDPASRERRLAVRGPVDGTFAAGDPVDFSLYSNYGTFIDHYRLELFHARDTDFSRPLRVLEGKKLVGHDSITWDGKDAAGNPVVPGSALTYRLRVYDAEGRMDTSAAGGLHATVQRPVGVAPTADRNDPEAGRASTETPPQTARIPVQASRIRVHGRGIPADAALTLNGKPMAISADGRVAAESLVQPGSYELEFGMDQGWSESRQIDVSERYWFVVGLADFTAGENSPAGNVELLEGDERYDGETYVDGRIAVYLKGKVKGKHLLTAHVDTTEEGIDDLFDNLDREDPRQLFRRIDPDRYYPVYGDGSTTVNDVNSQGRMYVHFAWDESEALWGNYHTNFTGTEFAEFNRTLYGAKVHHRSKDTTKYGEHRAEINAFGSEAQSAFGHNEFIGTGGSLYYLRDTDIVLGSEKVWIEVRDRDSGRVIERQVLERGRDYDLDELQGRVILTRPLTQVADQAAPSIIRDTPLDGNRVLLLVDYEYIPGGFSADDATAGFRGKGWVTDDFAVGATYVNEERNNLDYQMQGVDLTLRKGEGTYLKAEYVETESTQLNSSFGSLDGGLTFTPISTGEVAGQRTAGEAIAIEGRLNMADFGDREGTAAVWWRDRSAGFSTARLATDRDVTEYGGEVRWKVGERTTLAARAAVTEIGENELRDEAAGIQLDHRSSGGVGISGEIRHVQEEIGNAGAVDGTLAGFRLSVPVTEQTDVYGAVQLEIDSDDNYQDNNLATLGVRTKVGDRAGLRAEASSGDRGDAVRVGADYSMPGGSQVYMNYTESVDRIDGQTGAMVVGRRSQLSNQLQLFNEAQFTERRGESALSNVVGVDYRPDERWRVGVTVQQAALDNPLLGGIDRDAVSFLFDYAGERSTYRGKVEYRHDSGGRNERQWVQTNFFRYRANPSTSMVMRFNSSQSDNRAGDPNNARFIESSVGVAFRPVRHDRFNLLSKYSYLFDLPSTGQRDLRPDQRTHVFSAEALYELSARWQVGAKLAERRGEMRLLRDQGPWLSSDAQLALAQLRYHMLHSWDAVIDYRVLTSDEAGDERRGALAALYRHIQQNLKVGVGYNFTDFSDDLTDLDYDNDGWFVKLLGKF